MIASDVQYKKIKLEVMEDESFYVDKKNNYVYKITNLINGQYYYGVRSCNCNIEDDKYMGSGTRLHRAFRKYGIENFEKTIVKNFSTRKETVDLEKEIVNEDLIKDPNCYNIVLGGGGLNGIVAVEFSDGTKGAVPISEYDPSSTEYTHKSKGLVTVFDSETEVTKKIPREEYLEYKKSQPGRYIPTILHGNKNGIVNAKDKDGNVFPVHYDDPRLLSGELRYYKGERDTRKVYVNDGTRYICVKPEKVGQFLEENPTWKLGMIKSKRYTESRSKLMSDRRGKYVRMTNGIDKNKDVLPEEVEYYESIGWRKGNKKFKPVEKGSTTGLIGITNGEENKLVKPELLSEYLNNGWRKGRTDKYKKGRVIVNNGEISKFIYPEDLDSYILNGWSPGRAKRKLIK